VDIVAVGAHPDDGEIAMGASLAGFVRRGYSAAIIDLTDGEPTPFGNKPTRRREAAAAALELGVTRHTLKLPNRKLFDTVAARESLAVLLRKMRPWVLFLPYPVDAHPDHWEGSALALAGRFYSKLSKTTMAGKPWYPPNVFYHLGTHLGHAPEPPLILDVSEDFRAKMRAVSCYQSQFYKGPRQGEMEEKLEVRARFYGMMIGVRYGEPFYSLEPTGLSDFDSLVLPGQGTLGRRRGTAR